jgi:hypothetical protein
MYDDDWKPDPHIQKIVDAKLAEVRPLILDKVANPSAINGDPFKSKDYIVVDGTNEHGTMMRLDWELSSESAALGANEVITDLMLEQISVDFCDILENGDRDKTDDPFLGWIDGTKKHGKELAAVTLGDITLCREYHKVKDTHEFTIFMRLGAIWS